MKTIRAFLAGLFALTLLFTLSGCFQAEQVINVKPDGSGTVVLTIKMSKEALAQAKAFGGNDAGGDPVEQMMKPEETEKLAKKLGEGVKFVKAEPYAEGNFAGKRATFSFTDINKVKADMNMGPDAGDDDTDKEPIKFEFKPGSPATLLIHAPVKAKKEDKPDDPQEAAQMAAAAPMMKDMRITIAVNVEGTIVSTDAENKDGTRITFVDLPVGEAFKDFKRFKAIDKATDWPSAAKLMKELPGAKIETKSVVKVQFK